MGGLARRLPHTAIAMAVATAAITGVVPLSGFFSKDAILGMEFSEQNRAFPWAPHLLYAVGTLAAFGTAFYMGRLFWLAFAGTPRSPAAEHAHEAPPAMTGVTYVLAALSILTLLLGLPSEDGPLLERFLAPFFNPAIERARDLTIPPEHGVPWGLYETALAISWAGFAISIYWYLGRGKEVPARLRARAPGLFRVIENKFYVDEIYDALIVVPLLSGARLTWRVIDVGLIDTVFVRGIGALLKAISLFVLKPLQNGNVQRYAAVLALGTTVLLWRILL
jgi:NADH-quinone oxidoreductase subunit L